jgi:hypothetical protein
MLTSEVSIVHNANLAIFGQCDNANLEASIVDNANLKMDNADNANLKIAKMS